jgi:hypothetical protein
MKTLGSFYLEMDKPTNRIIRRALIGGILSAVSIGITMYLASGEVNPTVISILTALLLGIDKAISENKK